MGALRRRRRGGHGGRSATVMSCRWQAPPSSQTAQSCGWFSISHSMTWARNRAASGSATATRWPSLHRRHAGHLDPARGIVRAIEHLHRAQPAGPDRAERAVPAEMRHVHALFQAGGQQVAARLRPRPRGHRSRSSPSWPPPVHAGSRRADAPRTDRRSGRAPRRAAPWRRPSGRRSCGRAGRPRRPSCAARRGRRGAPCPPPAPSRMRAAQGSPSRQGVHQPQLSRA